MSKSLALPPIRLPPLTRPLSFFVRSLTYHKIALPNIAALHAVRGPIVGGVVPDEAKGLLAFVMSKVPAIRYHNQHLTWAHAKDSKEPPVLNITFTNGKTRSLKTEGLDEHDLLRALISIDVDPNTPVTVRPAPARAARPTAAADSSAAASAPAGGAAAGPAPSSFANFLDIAATVETPAPAPEPAEKSTKKRR